MGWEDVMGIVKDVIGKIKGRISPPREVALMEGIRRGSRAFCGPEQLHIDLTNKCNLTCIACWHRSPLLDKEDIWPHWDTKYELPLEVVLSLIDEAAAMDVRKVIFSGGGECLLYKDIFRVLEYTSSKGIDILLISNLAVADKEMIGRVIESGVNQLLVNLWAGSPSVYVAAHPGTSERTFFRILELMKTFVELRHDPRDPELIISDVICSTNYKDVENMVRLAVDIGAYAIWFQTVDVESDKLRGLLLSKGQIGELIRDLRAIKEKYAPLLNEYQKSVLDFDDFLEKLENSRAPEGIYHSDVIDTMPCYMGWAACRILANGNVVPCCKADKHPLGNITTRSFREIWFSRRYNEFRKRAKVCSKSDAYFRKIDCAKVCDNWWFNKIIHRRYGDYMREGQC